MRVLEERRQPTVAIVYKWIPQYRKEFFEDLEKELRLRGVVLQVIYGSPEGEDAAKRDSVTLAWGAPIKNRYLGVAGRRFIWQPCLRMIRGADLVIVEQANRLLVNYLLVVGNSMGLLRLAFWGHGRNFQSTNSDKRSEALKRLVARSPHWWFAYNELSAEAVRQSGFPDERITRVQNSIDTRVLDDARRRMSEDQRDATRKKFGLSGTNVCIFCGSLYEDKRLELLLDACVRIRAEVPDFEILIVGAGPKEQTVRNAARIHDWVHYLGPRFGVDKAECFTVVKLLLIPGLVGLAIVDSFVMRVPLVTTRVDFHSPEIEYLIDGVNGIMVDVAESSEPYASCIVGLLRDDESMAVLREGCSQAAQQYTLAAMVERFADGVLLALEDR